MPQLRQVLFWDETITMHNNSRERYFEFTLLFLIFLLGFALIKAALPFLSGILGALTLYMLLRRMNFYLSRKTSPRLSPWIITLTVSVFCLIPLAFLAWYCINLLQGLQDFNVNAVIERIKSFTHIIEERTGYNLLSEEALSFAAAKLSAIANMLMAGVNDFAVNLFTAVLLLYFLLAGGFRMERYIARLLPFADENKLAVINKVNLIVKSNAIGIPLLALMQAAVAYVGYLIFSVSNPLLFAVLTGCASIIPIVGTMIVWVPLLVIQFFEGSTLQAVGLLVYGGLIISQCDNVLRMFLQKKMANTHPLITIFGVIAGLPLFGFMGVIFGPLITAMFLLFLDMFAKQYILGPGRAREEKGKNSRSAPGNTPAAGSASSTADSSASASAAAAGADAAADAADHAAAGDAGAAGKKAATTTTATTITTTSSSSSSTSSSSGTSY